MAEQLTQPTLNIRTENEDEEKQTPSILSSIPREEVPQPSMYRLADPTIPEQQPVIRQYYEYKADLGPYPGVIGDPEQLKEQEKAILDTRMILRADTPPELIQRFNTAEALTQQDIQALQPYMNSFGDKYKDLGTRYAKMWEYDSPYVLRTNPETGRGEIYATSLRREYEYYTKPKGDELFEEYGALGVAAEATRSALLGAGGYGDMQELDNYLKEKGLSQAQRTVYLRRRARGEYVGPMIKSAPVDLGTFIQNTPSMAVDLVKFLNNDVILPAREFLTGEDLTETKERLATGLSPMVDYLPSYAEEIAEREGIAPEIVEGLLTPEGALNRANYFAAGEAPIALGQFALHAGRTIKTYFTYEKTLKDQYGGKDLKEALGNAFNEGKTMGQINEEFFTSRVNAFGRRQAERDLDSAMSYLVALPGATRAEAMGDRIQKLKTLRETINKDIANARNPKDRARQQARLAKAEEEELRIRSEILLPKWLRDFGRDNVDQLAYGVAAGEAASYILGPYSEAVPLAEFFGSVGAVVPQIRSFVSGGTELTGNVFVDGLRLLSRVGPEGVREAGESLKVGREAKLFVNHIMKQGGPLRDSFLTGAEEAAKIRRDLTDISNATGVDIDVDYFTESVAFVADMAVLQTLKRQVANQMSIGSLTDINNDVAKATDVINRERQLINQLSEATQKLIDLQITGNLSGYEAVDTLVRGMSNYIEVSSSQLDEYEGFIKGVVGTQDDMIEIFMRGDNPADLQEGSTSAIVSLQEIFNAQDSVAKGKGVPGQKLIDTSLEPDRVMREKILQFDELAKKRAQLYNSAAKSLRVDEAASGGASSRFAAGFVTTKSYFNRKGNDLYDALDADFADVRADATNFFDEYFGKNKKSFADYMPEEIDSASLKMAKLDSFASTDRGMAMMFDKAAQDSFKFISADPVSKRVLDKVFEVGEYEGRGINTWSEIRNDLRDPSSENIERFRKVFGAPDTSDAEVLNKMTSFADTMPLPIRASDWRQIDKALGNIAFDQSQKAGAESRGFFYTNMTREWEEISENFMRGWGGDTPPQDVSEAWSKRFGEANEYWRYNVKTRINADPQARQWSRFISRAAQQAKDSEKAVSEISVQYAPNLKPTKWLDSIFDRFKDFKEAPTDARLYENVEEPLAKYGGGVYDKESGQYRILIDSSDPEEAVVADLGRSLQELMKKHMQGRLARTPGGQHILAQVNKKGPVWDWTKEVNEPLDFSDVEFQTMFNVRVYRRDETGKIVEAGKLVDPDEVFDAIDVTALELNRKDLGPVFRNAKTYIKTRKARIENDMGDYRKKAQAEITFMQEIKGTVLGVKTKELKLTDLENISDSVYRMAVSGKAGTSEDQIMRLKANLRTQAQEMNIPAEEVPGFVDDFIRRMVIDNIYRKSSQVNGRFTTELENGEPIRKAAIGLDGNKITELLGREGSEEQKNLISVLGPETYERFQSIATTLSRLDADELKGIRASTKGISMESVLSRVYNIQRGVVSPQWIGTELAIRGAKNFNTSLLMSMLNDPKVADEVLTIIETGKVPKYKREPLFVSGLLRETIRSEATHRFMLDTSDDKEARDFYYPEQAGQEEEQTEEPATPVQPATPTARPQMAPVDQQMLNLTRGISP